MLFVITNILCGDKFVIADATSQEWHGGREETGYGTYYELTIIPKTNSENLMFDKLWIGDKYFEIQCFQKGKRVKNNTFNEGDTITIQINDAYIPNKFQKEKSKMKHEDLPLQYKGEALLSYKHKNKRKYKTIKSFKKLENLNYQ